MYGDVSLEPEGFLKGGALESIIVGFDSELVLENEALPVGSPVTVVQFLSRNW